MTRGLARFRPGGRRPATALILAGLLLHGSNAPGQDDGPVIITRDRQLESRITRFDAAIDLLASWQFDETKPRNGPKLKDTEERFRQILDLGTEGFIGHPNLINFDLNGRFGLEQQDIDSQTEDVRDQIDEEFIEFDARADFVRRTRLPFTLYALRDQTDISRQFGASLDSTITEFGGIISYRSDFAPTRAQIFHREEDQTDVLQGDDFSLSQDTIDASGQLIFSTTNNLRWDYTFDMVDQSGRLRPANSFERHDAFITHEWQFGDDRQDSLRSSLRYLNETGDFALERLRLTETLRFMHTPAFETRYDYTFDHQERFGETQMLHLGTARLRHRLFESLVTTAEIGASSFELQEESFTSTELFGSGEVEYSKKVPYGRFKASALVSYNTTNNSERGSELQVTDEVQIFGATGLVVLSRQNIIPSSIVVTDTRGIIIYSAGADYTVRAFADRVELRRVLGGDIAEGQAVLVDYRIGPEPGNTTDTLGIGGSVRYSIDEGYLRGLSVYLRYFWQDQSRSEDRRRPFFDPLAAPLFVENDFTDLIVGAEYDIWRLSFLGEYQTRDSTLSPFDATRLEGYYTHQLGRGSSIVLSAIYNEIDRTSDDIQTTITTYSARWNQQVDRYLSTRLLVIWREETDSAGVDTEAFEQQFEVTWDYRQTSVYASVRNAFVNTDERDSTFQTYVVGLRREF